jgi:hypothetical protein
MKGAKVRKNWHICKFRSIFMAILQNRLCKIENIYQYLVLCIAWYYKKLYLCSVLAERVNENRYFWHGFCQEASKILTL